MSRYDAAAGMKEGAVVLICLAQACLGFHVSRMGAYKAYRQPAVGPSPSWMSFDDHHGLRASTRTAMLPPLTAVQQAASETVERDTLEWAESAIVAGDLASAEAVLMRLRSRDPHRDMPRRLHEAFLALFRAYAEAEPDKLWPLEGLSALHMDAEEWDLCLDTCSQAIDKHAPPGPQNLQEGAGRSFPPSLAMMRMRRLRAARSCFSWANGGGGGAGDVAEARALALIPDSVASEAAVPPLQAFASLALPLTPSTCALIGAAYLRRAVHAASSLDRTPLPPLPSLPPPPSSSARSAGSSASPTSVPEASVERLRVGFLTPDANGAHPLGQLMAGALHHFNSHNLKTFLFTMCRDDESAERRGFEEGVDEVVDVTAWEPIDIAAEVRRRGVHVLIDLCGHAGTQNVLEVMALRPAPITINGGMGTPAPMGPALAAVTPNGLERVYDYALCDAVVVPDEALLEKSQFTPSDKKKTVEAGGLELVSEEAVQSMGRWGWAHPLEHRALRLPHTYFVCDHARPTGPSVKAVWDRPQPDRRALGLDPDAVVLACMNRGHKVDAVTFDHWLHALRRTTNHRSQLWILAPLNKHRGSSGNQAKDEAANEKENDGDQDLDTSEGRRRLRARAKEVGVPHCVPCVSCILVRSAMRLVPALSHKRFAMTILRWRGHTLHRSWEMTTIPLASCLLISLHGGTTFTDSELPIWPWTPPPITAIP